MGEKRQSIIIKALERARAENLIRREYSKFKRLCGFEPALSESLFFKSCCAALIEDLGYIPPAYVNEAATYLKLHKIGMLRAGVPTEKGWEVNG